jgi:hypothetical protein
MDHPPKPRLTLSIGVIGHRPYRLPSAKLGLIEAEVERVISLVSHEVGVVHRRYEQFFGKADPQLCLVSALAEGADSIVAAAAISRGLVLDAPIPFLKEEYVRDFVGDTVHLDDKDAVGTVEKDAMAGAKPIAPALAQFEALESSARSLLQLPGERRHDDCANNKTADKAYETAALTLIGQSDILLAVWDAGPSGGAGGTADMLPQAVRRGVPIIEINVSDLCNTRILWSSLRESPIAAEHVGDLPAERFEQALPRLIEEFLRPPSAENERIALLSYIEAPASKTWWRSCAAWFARVFGLRKRLAARAAGRAVQYGKLMEGAGGYGSPSGEKSSTLLAKAFGWADAKAIQSAEIFRLAYIFNFTASALAVIAALFSLLVKDPPYDKWPPLIEITLIILVLLNTGAGRRFGWHMRWLEARELAERMRVAILFWVLGAQPAAFLGEEPAWTGWYARAIIREQGMRGGRLDLDGMSAARAAMLKVLHDQHDYHRSNSHNMRRREVVLERVGQAFFLATLVLAIAHVWGEGFTGWLFGDYPKHHVVHIILTAILPTVATAIYGIRVIGDFEGRAKRSERTELGHLRVIEALRRDPADLILFRARAQIISDAMLGDVSSWRLSAESRGLAVPG